MARTTPAGRLLHGFLLASAVGALLFAVRSGAADTPAPKPVADERLARQLSLEARSADLRELTSRLSSSLGTRLETDANISDQRVTVRGANVSVASLQRALAVLLHTQWRAAGDNSETRYRLLDNAELRKSADQLRTQRLTVFLRRLLETQQSLRSRNPELVARSIRDSVALRMPYLSEEALDEISPDYLDQTMLMDPLRLGLIPSLVKNDYTWVPFQRLSAVHRQLLAGFFMQRYEASTQLGQAPGETGATRTVASVTPNPAVLNSPQARLEYRLLFGDQWTGTSLVTRIGSADNWASSVVPSTLFALPDYATLYPEADQRPAAKELERNVNVRVDTDTDTWDQALTSVARAANINVLSDSYLRPEVYHPRSGGPVLIGTTVGETLDHLADYYGYIWWKDGDWYLFRNRLWFDEQKSAVPPRLLQSMSNSIGNYDHLSSANLTSLAALPEDQLLSLQLYGSAAGKSYAPESSMDLNQLDLLRTGLTLYAQLSEQQREAARMSGLPVALMAPIQQFQVTSMAYDRGIPIDPYDESTWRLAVSDHFERQKLSTGWAQVGQLTVQFDMGQYGTRTATLTLRLPATEPPKETAK